MSAGVGLVFDADCGICDMLSEEDTPAKQIAITNQAIAVGTSLEKELSSSMACSRNLVMAQKIMASQFTYASRAIATPERHCPTQCALAHAFEGDRPSLDCGPRPHLSRCR